MVETSIAPRFRVDKPGIAEYGGDKYPCRIRDFSTTGAAIEFPERVDLIPIAKAFTLVIPHDRLRLLCRVVWKNGYKMGIGFD